MAAMRLGFQAAAAAAPSSYSAHAANCLHIRLFHQPSIVLARPNVIAVRERDLATINSDHIFNPGETNSRSFVTTRATLDDEIDLDIDPSRPLVEDQPPSREVEESVRVLKTAAKTRKVATNDVLSALSVIEKAKLDPSGFLNTLGGSDSPGRTWMLIFTAEKKLTGGRYFPLTAVQSFDAAGKRIENGVYLGSIGSMTFEGRFSWKKRVLAFIFERIRIKVGPLEPLEIGLGAKDQVKEPSNKDPFFIWFYIDEEIAVARGKSGGTAFWCRCRRVSSPFP